MKTNKSVAALSAFLQVCKPDLKDILEQCRGTFEHKLYSFEKEYRAVCVGSVANVEGLLAPCLTRSQKEYTFNAHTVQGTTVFKNGDETPYTTLDSLVNVQSPEGAVPTLVEMSILRPDNIGRYFIDEGRKLEVMRSLFNDNFAWILMLPADYSNGNPLYLRNFQNKGGHISVIRYSVADIHRMIGGRTEKLVLTS